MISEAERAGLATGTLERRTLTLNERREPLSVFSLRAPARAS